MVHACYGNVLPGRILHLQRVCESLLEPAKFSLSQILTDSIHFSSNNQKIQFKEDPTKPIWGKQPQTIRTIRGTELLISGYWSLVRKPNYIGDILIAAAMSMPCQTVSTVVCDILHLVGMWTVNGDLQSVYTNMQPYLYPAYLFLLLLHRAHRDNQRCSKKYGVSWKEYCNKVKWVMFPGIY